LPRHLLLEQSSTLAAAGQHFAMAPSFPLLAVLALAASRCPADSQCSDAADPQMHGAESDDDGALAQLRTARVRPNLKGGGSGECTPAQDGNICWSGSMCCGNIVAGQSSGNCQCCTGECPGSDSTDEGNADTTTSNDFSIGLTSTAGAGGSDASTGTSTDGAGGSECTAPGAISGEELTGDGPARLKAAGKCGADDCVCSTGLISIGGCRTCSAFR